MGPKARSMVLSVHRQWRSLHCHLILYCSSQNLLTEQDSYMRLLKHINIYSSDSWAKAATSEYNEHESSVITTKPLEHAHPMLYLPSIWNRKPQHFIRLQVIPSSSHISWWNMKMPKNKSHTINARSINVKHLRSLQKPHILTYKIYIYFCFIYYMIILIDIQP